MLSTSQFLTDTEEKEILKQERESLLEFLKEAQKLLDIKNIDELDTGSFKNEYVRQHANMNKDELIIRLSVLDDLLEFMKDYK